MNAVNVVSAEITKFRTLRSNLLAVVVSGLVLAVAAFALARSSESLTGSLVAAEPVALPMEYFAYVFLVLGAVMVTSDFDSGTFGITSMLVPVRGQVVAAKLTAAALLGVLGAVPALVLVTAGAVLGDGGGLAGLSQGPALEAVASNLAPVPLSAVLGAAVGLLLRSTALSISLLLLWSIAVETVLVFIVPETYGAFLPFKTIGASRMVMEELSWAAGLGLFTAFVLVVALLATLVQLRRRGSPA